MKRLKNNIGSYSHFVGVCLLLGLFVPHTSIMLMLINPILCLLLFFNNSLKFPVQTRGIVFGLCFVIFVSLIFSALLYNHESSKYFLATISLLLLLICFPLSNGCSIPKMYFYIAISYIFLSQLVYVFHVSSLISFFERFYPIGADDVNAYTYMLENIDISSALNYRHGGLFHNANQTARYICVISVAFFALYKDEKVKDILLYIILSLSSILMTGSRTGLVVYSLSFLLFLHINPNVVKRTEFLIYIVIVIFVLPLFIVGSSQIRGFNISQGFEDSANIKLDVLKDYFSQNNSIFHLLFGYSDTKLFVPTTSTIMSIFDSEYGDLIFDYGFLGFILVIGFYIKCFRLCEKKERIFFISLLWMITSTVLLSYRMSFVFMLLLSVFVARGINQSNGCKIHDPKNIK